MMKKYYFRKKINTMYLGEFLVPMGSKPDPGKRALFGQNKMCIKHFVWISLSASKKLFSQL